MSPLTMFGWWLRPPQQNGHTSWQAACPLCADFVAKVFLRWDSNSPSSRRDDRIIMWGTTSLCDKLTGDSGNGFEAALIGDCRLFCPLAENLPQPLLGLLQQNLPTSEVAALPTISGDTGCQLSNRVAASANNWNMTFPMPPFDRNLGGDAAARTDQVS